MSKEVAQVYETHAGGQLLKPGTKKPSIQGEGRDMNSTQSSNTSQRKEYDREETSAKWLPYSLPAVSKPKKADASGSRRHTSSCSPEMYRVRLQIGNCVWSIQRSVLLI